MALPAEKIKNSSLPPMLQQYLDYKERYPDCLLFFQVGDFYELFFEDAITTAQSINITLTSRDKSSENPIPMCGVPLSVADQYCDRLIQLGFSVAIVSQVSDPSTSQSKGMVTRRLERIITPSVKILAGADSAAAQGLLAAIALRGSQEAAVAFTDVQSGTIQIKDSILVSEIPSICALYSVAEILLPKQVGAQLLDRRTSWVRSLETVFDKKNIKFRFFDLSPSPHCQRLEHFSSLSPLAKDAAVSLMSYLDEVIVERQVPIERIEVAKESDRVSIDATTRMNLELVKNVRDGSERGTLLEYLKFTVTPGGTRFLRNEIVSPLRVSSEIDSRLEKVEAFLKASEERAVLRKLLSESPDIERIAARTDLEVVTPRELASLRDILERIPQIATIVKPFWNTLFGSQDQEIGLKIFTLLNDALVLEPPLSSAEGGIIKPSYNAELHRLEMLENSSNTWLTEFEQQQRAATSIPSLKVKYTSVFGYFIEVSNAHLSKVPSSYIRKQTTTNSERFITEDLKKQEVEILQAHDKRVLLEKELFSTLRNSLKTYIPFLKKFHTIISELDFILSLSECAYINRLTRPTISAEPILTIEQGQHPQIAKILGSQFIPNDLSIAGGDNAKDPAIMLITGPNMGGKSTYLRQNALLTVMAHVGSFVPAQSAIIGITDQIFARLGASDNLSEGESTFMVEMREVSLIARNATHRSLVVIDEIGRGTATRDGLSIAQAILEWLIVQVKARVLFATHFHELTELEVLYPTIVKNISVGSAELDGELIFTHTIIPGSATKSFGIEVAKMAGLPDSIIERSKILLQKLLERSEVKSSNKKAQLSLFTSAPIVQPQSSTPKLSESQQKIISSLEAIEIDKMTPLEALNSLSQLKKYLSLVLSFFLIFSMHVQHSYAEYRKNNYEELKTQYLRLRNTDSAVRNFNQWVQIAEDFIAIAPSLPENQSAQAIFNAATAYRTMYSALGKADNKESAIQLYSRITEEYPKAQIAAQSLKSLYELLKDEDQSQALQYLKRLKQEYPNSEFADFARIATSTDGTVSSGITDRKLLTNTQKIIVIDPGHGGEDFGAVGVGGLLEKDVTLSISEEIQKILNKDPWFNILLTRTADVFMPLEQRTAFANHNDADLFLSIHCNSSEKGTLNGFELFTLDNSGDAATKKLAERENNSGARAAEQNDLSLFLSDLIQTTKSPESTLLASLIEQEIKKDFSEIENFPIRKAKKAPFFVLVGAHMPSVLIETAFINHQDDGVMLSTDEIRNKFALSISNGIRAFFKHTK